MDEKVGLQRCWLLELHFGGLMSLLGRAEVYRVGEEEQEVVGG